jgi:hypothetical protein
MQVEFLKTNKPMEYRYQQSFLDDKIDFKFEGWLQVRRDHKQSTRIIRLKNKRMMFDNGIYNSRTPILIFLN